MTDTKVANILENRLTTAHAGQVILFNNMQEIMKGAELMASAHNVVPKHLINNPGGCLAIIMQAQRWGMDAFAVAQKTHVVNGQLGYEAQLVNAVLKSSGAVSSRFHYKYEGEGASLKCQVGAVIAGEKDITWGQWLGLSEVQTKNSPLWKSNPKQQLGYLQVKNWARAYCPEAILGVYTPEELAESPRTEREIGPYSEEEKPSKAEALKSRLVDEVEDVEPATTFADVAAAINQAETMEALSEIANNQVVDFLGDGDNGQYREELMAVYKYRQGQLKGDDEVASGS